MGPTEDAETVISIYNPNREKLSTYHGYDIKILGGNFRMVTVLKSRYGDTDVEIGCNFFGHINYWKELPRPDEIYDISKYTNPSYILKDEHEEIPDETLKKKLTFKI